jgi:hypothetical protein
MVRRFGMSRLGFPALSLALAALLGCEAGDTGPEDPDATEVDRHAAIPSDAVKVTPAQDPTPPVLHSPEFQEPVPLPVISTAGAEDAPFIPAGREELYFFFAADVREAASIQIRDPVNGIWVSKRIGGSWQEPTLVWLQEPGVLALNGCPFVGGNEMFFCTAREGYAGLNWFRALYANGAWGSWTLYPFEPSLDVGELHIHGDDLYYHSGRAGGAGGIDIWMATRDGELWANPVNVTAVNSAEDDSRPYVTPDGNELWITRWYQGTPALFRSKKVGGEWQKAELIVSRFAGEPTLDAQGNLYFVHHFYDNGVMLEADIYVAYRTTPLSAPPQDPAPPLSRPGPGRRPAR